MHINARRNFLHAFKAIIFSIKIVSFLIMKMWYLVKMEAMNYSINKWRNTKI